MKDKESGEKISALDAYDIITHQEAQIRLFKTLLDGASKMMKLDEEYHIDMMFTLHSRYKALSEKKEFDYIEFADKIERQHYDYRKRQDDIFCQLGHGVYHLIKDESFIRHLFDSQVSPKFYELESYLEGLT